MAKKKTAKTYTISQMNVFIGFSVLLVIIGLLVWKNKILNQEVTTSQISHKEDAYITPLNDDDTEFINNVAKFSFNFPNYYKIKYYNPNISAEWTLEIDKSKVQDVNYELDIIGSPGTDSVEEANIKYSRIITTQTGLSAKQYILIPESDHPQGATVYTIIKNDKSSIAIYTFINNIIDNLEQKRSVTSKDYENILDNELGGYNQIINTFKFL